MQYLNQETAGLPGINHVVMNGSYADILTFSAIFIYRSVVVSSHNARVPSSGARFVRSARRNVESTPPCPVSILPVSTLAPFPHPVSARAFLHARVPAPLLSPSWRAPR